MKTIKTIRSLSSRLLAEEALKRGISVKHLNPYQDDEAFLELDYRKHKEFIIGQRISKTSLEAYWITEEKALTKNFLKIKNINVVSGKIFKKNNYIEISDYCKKIKFPVVVKPIAGAHGESVYTNIKNSNELKIILKKVFIKNNYILAEKMFFGNEYRLIATRSKFLAATNRVPANIVGDGIHNVKELITIKNNNPRRGGDYKKALIKIKVDKGALEVLKKQKLRLTSVIKKNKVISLRNNSNLSTGGDSVDVTDLVHQDIKKIAVKIIRAIPYLAYAGIDIMVSENISKKPTKKNYAVVEMNSSPMISMHHFPYKGKSRNVAKKIIDILFSETQ